MDFEARIEPLGGTLPKVSYHWDPETDILSVACKGGAKANGLNGTVDLLGADGSFVVIDVAGGCLQGVDVVAWPDDVRTVADLATPAATKDGRVVFPTRQSQPGDIEFTGYAQRNWFQAGVQNVEARVPDRTADRRVVWPGLGMR